MGSHIEIFDRSDLPSVTVRFEVSRYACCKEELMEAMCISQLVLAVTDAFEKHGKEHPLWLEVSEVGSRWSAGSIICGTRSPWQKGDGSKCCLSHSIL